MTDSGLQASLEAHLGDLHLDVAIEVAAGQTIAMLGPNGAGKTTLLRALAGLQALDRGRVVVDGDILEDVAARRWVPPEARSQGFVFQDHALFPHLSALDNVAFGLEARGLRRGEAGRKEAAAMLARVGLADQAQQRPRALSGGQAQRVALARALATRPKLLLLDEPLAVLDATTRAATRADLRSQLADHVGVRVLVTHDPLDAAALADQVLILEGGRVSQAGTLAEISAHPRSTYVADLVGVNLFRGVATAGVVVLDDGTRVASADRAEGDAVAVVHPRAVALHRRRPEGTARNVWSGAAQVLQRDGDRVRVQVSISPGTVLLAEVTAAAAEDLGLYDGGAVFASVKATEVVVTPA